MQEVQSPLGRDRGRVCRRSVVGKEVNHLSPSSDVHCAQDILNIKYHLWQCRPPRRNPVLNRTRCYVSIYTFKTIRAICALHHTYCGIPPTLPSAAMSTYPVLTQ